MLSEVAGVMKVYKLKKGKHKIFVDDFSRNDDYVYIRETESSNKYLITKDYLLGNYCLMKERS